MIGHLAVSGETTLMCIEFWIWIQGRLSRGWGEGARRWLANESVIDFAVNVDERLRLNSCLDDYKLQEIVVVSKERGGPLSLEQQHSPSKMSSAKAKLRGAVSSTSEAADKKKRGGFLGKFFGKSKKGSVSRLFGSLLSWDPSGLLTVP